MKAICYALKDSGRSRTVASAMAQGFIKHGWQAEIRIGFAGAVSADVVVGYGWAQRRMFDAYRAHGAQYLYIDMGYWNRKPPANPRGGHHKVVLNGWCPSQTMRHGMPSDRLERLNVLVRETAGGANVVVAGMSAKSAADHSLRPSQWEASAIEMLARDWPCGIIYRPKPSWAEAQPIAGSSYDNSRQPIEMLLANAHALITHHSNAAVDALVAGVPYYCERGAARSLSLPSLSGVQHARPASLAERKALLSDIAYLQWTPLEMSSGACFDHYKGLL